VVPHLLRTVLIWGWTKVLFQESVRPFVALTILIHSVHFVVTLRLLLIFFVTDGVARPASQRLPVADVQCYRASSGPNKTLKLSVTRIGRPAAEKIFYRALTLYLGPSSNFSNARAASLRAAADLYGTGSTQYNATAQAWTAVGVQ